MNNKENIAENFTGTLVVETEKINIPIHLTEVQMLVVENVLGLEVLDLGNREYDVRCYDDEDLLTML